MSDYVLDTTERGRFRSTDDCRCAVASCNSPNPTLYDDKLDQYYCDMECLAAYIAEHPDRFADWYAFLNTHLN